MIQQVSELSSSKERLESEYKDIVTSLNALKNMTRKYDEQMQTILTEKYEPHKVGFKFYFEI